MQRTKKIKHKQKVKCKMSLSKRVHTIESIDVHKHMTDLTMYT